MKRKLWGLILMVAVLGLGLAQPASGDGDFYVIAGGGGVGKAITSLPYTISQSGFYYLKGNLSTTSGGDAITIAASDVTLDLMGFCLDGTPNIINGIYINSGMKNVEVRNGHLKSCYIGIRSTYGGHNHRITNLKVRACVYGIYGSAYGTIITGCAASENQQGITCDAYAVVIDKNIASNNPSIGFNLSTFRGNVTNNSACNNGTGFYLPGVSGALVDRNSSYGNTVANWDGLTGCTTGLNTPAP